MSQSQYANAETVEQIEQAREEVGGSATKDDEDASFPEFSEEEVEEARHTIASEEQPDGELPDLRITETVGFRGHDFEFGELGKSQLEASKFSDMEEGDVERGTEAGEFVYKAVAKASVDADLDYWSQYDLQSPGDTDGVMDLFNRIIQAHNDVDPEELEKAKNSL